MKFDKLVNTLLESQEQSVEEIDENNNKLWRTSNGIIHRINGPAVERADGSELWMQNGERHREDGPAVIWKTGKKEWWLNGEEFTEERFKELLFNRSLASREDAIFDNDFLDGL